MVDAYIAEAIARTQATVTECLVCGSNVAYKYLQHHSGACFENATYGSGVSPGRHQSACTTCNLCSRPVFTDVFSEHFYRCLTEYQDNPGGIAPKSLQDACLLALDRELAHPELVSDRRLVDMYYSLFLCNRHTHRLTHAMERVAIDRFPAFLFDDAFDAAGATARARFVERWMAEKAPVDCIDQTCVAVFEVSLRHSIGSCIGTFLVSLCSMQAWLAMLSATLARPKGTTDARSKPRRVAELCLGQLVGCGFSCVVECTEFAEASVRTQDLVLRAFQIQMQSDNADSLEGWKL